VRCAPSLWLLALALLSPSYFPCLRLFLLSFIYLPPTPSRRGLFPLSWARFSLFRPSFLLSFLLPPIPCPISALPARFPSLLAFLFVNCSAYSSLDRFPCTSLIAFSSLFAILPLLFSRGRHPSPPLPLSSSLPALAPAPVFFIAARSLVSTPVLICPFGVPPLLFPTFSYIFPLCFLF